MPCSTVEQPPTLVATFANDTYFVPFVKAASPAVQTARNVRNPGNPGDFERLAEPNQHYQTLSERDILRKSLIGNRLRR